MKHSLHPCVVSYCSEFFFGELCGQMPESKTPVLDKKRPVDEVDSEIVKLRALAETGFQRWIKRVHGDYLAKRASALTMEWQKEGKNVPEMLAGMATLLQVGLEPERMLDLVEAWEDVASVKYDFAAMKFKPIGTQMGGGAPRGLHMQSTFSTRTSLILDANWMLNQPLSRSRSPPRQTT